MPLFKFFKYILKNLKKELTNDNDWQRMTTSDKECQRETTVTMSGRIITANGTTNEKEWKQVKNEWF